MVKKEMFNISDVYRFFRTVFRLLFHQIVEDLEGCLRFAEQKIMVKICNKTKIQVEMNCIRDATSPVISHA